jgi:hypothetical protein
MKRDFSFCDFIPRFPFQRLNNNDVYGGNVRIVDTIMQTEQETHKNTEKLSPMLISQA